jgi:hypothetical protein
MERRQRNKRKARRTAGASSRSEGRTVKVKQRSKEKCVTVNPKPLT